MNEVWVESCTYCACELPFFRWLLLFDWETNEEEKCPRKKRISILFSLAFRKSENAINSPGLTPETTFIYTYTNASTFIHWILLEEFNSFFCRRKDKIKVFFHQWLVYTIIWRRVLVLKRQKKSRAIFFENFERVRKPYPLRINCHA